MDIQQEIEQAIAEGLRTGVKVILERTYDNPLSKVFQELLSDHGGRFRRMLEQGVEECATDPAFSESIRAAVRSALAKTLVQRFGGELEKQVNALKSDPITRARITLALEQIVRERSAGG